ncbi:MAG TPA: ABC transporter permease subunit [Shinella sp.]|uniref:ABC transporter permease subunit n=1 Tax=Shinella sumterensis TaxID=1967501 RepID=A0AA50CSD8_9HYPH|nr:MULTISPECIES: ABC transporter permease subunit [Shinella]CAI0341803.1 putative ABC transporter membrane subunit YhdX [Rhizobiaceae bacterium]CAK7262267.1 putative ABC transporter membrane subunit YhdX [Shinella sp. WSC3-e]ANH09138.1 polar amino acid ABC transporter permease [Shinella sp. HZN7]MDC7260266.1 ABC transporter permease subunit [Shinella sp. YE25]WLS01198.1 ABC transporter permease subunit [Shinella sumterensis]
MLQDARFRAAAVQLMLLAGVATFGIALVSATAQNLQLRGIPVGFGFLWKPANFQIAETILPYSSSDPNWWAAVVGLANSLFISVLVIVIASVIGLFIGIGRLSNNPLMSGLCRGWVEIARNTPLVVLLIFTYALWWEVLPLASQAWKLGPGTHLSVRGLSMPALHWSASGVMPLAFVGAGLLGVFTASRAAHRRQSRTGRRPPYVLWAWIAVASGVALLLMLYRNALSIELPEFRRANFVGGWSLTPELTSILIGLTFYTAGFVGEIVRGGIVAVRRGQWEAATALGLTRAQTYRLVVLPLALRSIVPPMNSQYINVIKNSTLAIVVGYQDFMTVMSTMINKTSHAIEGVAMILGVFLLVNLALSALLNAYNRRIAIVER